MAVAPARVGNHHRVPAVGQELHFRRRRVCTLVDPQQSLVTPPGPLSNRLLDRVPIEWVRDRNALLKKQLRRLDRGIRPEPPLHRPIPQKISQRQKTHPLVVRHERPNDRARLPSRQPRRSVVDGLVEPIASLEPGPGQPPQVGVCHLRRHHERHHRRIRRDDQVVGQAALQPQTRHTERAVLIVEMDVRRVVARLRDAPGHASPRPVFGLTGDDRPARLVEQSALVGRHHKLRHQVLEHRAAPRNQRRPGPRARQQSPQSKPMVLGQAALRNPDETGQTSFRSE